ncbi:MAG: hypothetical protein IKY48_03700 [Bacteroidales bacterium]|nr:hypothetical protein [Bacteroidales bacterium]
MRNEMNVKPESGRLCFVERRVALSMPSGVGLCTSEQPDPKCGACAADPPALRFCGRLLVSSPRGLWAEGFLFVKPESAKPESGQLCFVERRVALSMLSGVGLCTSEQPDPHCAACTADLLALRFCGRSRSLLSLAGLPALRFCGTSSLPAKSEIGPAELVKSEIGPAELAKSEIGPAELEIYLAKSEADFARCEIDLARSAIDLARCEIGHADVKFYQGCLLAVHSPPYAVRFPP